MWSGPQPLSRVLQEQEAPSGRARQATSSIGYVLALWALARAMALLSLSFAQLRALAEELVLTTSPFPFLLAQVIGARSPGEQHWAMVRGSAGLVGKRIYSLLCQGCWERGSTERQTDMTYPVLPWVDGKVYEVKAG